MTPADAIGMLDRQITAHGDAVVVKQAGQDTPLRAFVRGYKPQEFANGVIQGDTLVVISQTDAVNLPLNEPRVGDKMMVAERLRKVMAVEPVTMKNVAIRYNCQVRG